MAATFWTGQNTGSRVGGTGSTKVLVRTGEDPLIQIQANNTIKNINKEVNNSTNKNTNKNTNKDTNKNTT